jgi:hypothetical protein
MKNSNKIILISLLAVGLVSCADSFLTRDPYGSTITQGQYEKMSDQLEGSMRGIYSMMYQYSDHDEFGERSIDMYTDLMSGDMALTNHIYGWFYTDELNQGVTNRSYYIWTYYYGLLRNINSVIGTAQTITVSGSTNVINRIATYGLPTTHKTSSSETTYYTIVAGDTLATYTETDAVIANCYAQALTMRGYVYSNLLMLFCNESSSISDFSSELCFPLYNENNMNNAQPLAKMSEVYTQVESDLTNAIDYFAAFSQEERSSKLFVDQSLACGILAYSYLNKGNKNGISTGDKYKEAYGNALKYAQQAIATSTCIILPQSQLLTTGFNDVNNVSWMWGQDVTTETATGLASFFGQVDIHSYSYAWAGDTKAIDENLYNEIPEYDGRSAWFNNGKANSTYKYCPDGKFYSAKSPNSTKSDDIDREWLSDNVFMRIESMYLIAAEASFRLNDDAGAISYLTQITDQRIATGKEAEYGTWKSGLNHGNLLEAIEYNWRVEMWGEGYGLQTFRRLGTERRRGANHAGSPGAAITPGSEYTFQMPSSETSYNPSIKGTTL